MDGSSFDRFTQELAANRTRRSVFKSLGATALGALGLASAGRAAAKSEKVTLCHKPGTPAQ